MVLSARLPRNLSSDLVVNHNPLNIKGSTDSRIQAIHAQYHIDVSPDIAQLLALPLIQRELPQTPHKPFELKRSVQLRVHVNGFVEAFDPAKRDWKQIYEASDATSDNEQENKANKLVQEIADKVHKAFDALPFDNEEDKNYGPSRNFQATPLYPPRPQDRGPSDATTYHLQQEIHDLRKEIDVLKQSHPTSENSESTAETELAETRELLEWALNLPHEQHAEYKKELETLEDRLKETQEVLDEVLKLPHKQLDEKRENIEALKMNREKVSELNAQLDEANDQLTQAKDEQTATESLFSDQAVRALDLEDSLNESKKRERHLSTELFHTQEIVSHLNQVKPMNQPLQTELSQARQSNASLTDQLQAERERLNSLEQEKNSLQQNQNQAAPLAEDNSRLRARLESAETELDQLRSKANQAQQQLASLEATVPLQKERIEQLQDEKSKLETQVAEKTTEASELRERFVTRSSERTEELLQAIRDTHAARNDVNINELMRELSGIMQKLSSSDEVRAFQEHIHELQIDKAKLETQLQDYLETKERLGNSEEKYQALQIKYAHSKEQLAFAQQHIQQITSAQDAIANLKEEILIALRFSAQDSNSSEILKQVKALTEQLKNQQDLMRESNQAFAATAQAGVDRRIYRDFSQRQEEKIQKLEAQVEKLEEQIGNTENADLIAQFNEQHQSMLNLISSIEDYLTNFTDQTLELIQNLLHVLIENSTSLEQQLNSMANSDGAQGMRKFHGERIVQLQDHLNSIAEALGVEEVNETTYATLPEKLQKLVNDKDTKQSEIAKLTALLGDAKNELQATKQQLSQEGDLVDQIKQLEEKNQELEDLVILLSDENKEMVSQSEIDALQEKIAANNKELKKLRAENLILWEIVNGIGEEFFGTPFTDANNAKKRLSGRVSELQECNDFLNAENQCLSEKQVEISKEPILPQDVGTQTTISKEVVKTHDAALPAITIKKSASRGESSGVNNSPKSASNKKAPFKKEKVAKTRGASSKPKGDNFNTKKLEADANAAVDQLTLVAEHANNTQLRIKGDKRRGVFNSFMAAFGPDPKNNVIKKREARLLGDSKSFVEKFIRTAKLYVPNHNKTPSSLNKFVLEKDKFFDFIEGLFKFVKEQDITSKIDSENKDDIINQFINDLITFTIEGPRFQKFKDSFPEFHTGKKPKSTYTNRDLTGNGLLTFITDLVSHNAAFKKLIKSQQNGGLRSEYWNSDKKQLITECHKAESVRKVVKKLSAALTEIFHSIDPNLPEPSALPSYRKPTSARSPRE